ncbi:MAG: hypothetical protein ABI835_18795, partial [Chloroflexota bacterium]
YFYRRNDLDWNSGVYFLQHVGLPVGGALPTSWRAYRGSAFDIPFMATPQEPVLPEATEIFAPVAIELTETVAPTETQPPTETATLAPTEEVTEEPTATEAPTSFPTLPIEEPTLTPSPFPTLPIDPPTAIPTDVVEPTAFPTLPIDPPTATPIPTPEMVALPAYASMDDGALDWLVSSGWTLTPEAAFGGLGLGWQVSATNTIEALRWSKLLDLRSVLPGEVVQFTYQSLLTSAQSSAIVQVSLDGSNWTSVGAATAWDKWTLETVDLSAYIGQLVYVQFVWTGIAPTEKDQLVDTWRVDEVSVAAVTPTATPTATDAPTDTPPIVEPPTDVPTDTPPSDAPPEATIPAPEDTPEAAPAQL